MNNESRFLVLDWICKKVRTVVHYLWFDEICHLPLCSMFCYTSVCTDKNKLISSRVESYVSGDLDLPHEQIRLYSIFFLQHRNETKIEIYNNLFFNFNSTNKYVQIKCIHVRRLDRDNCLVIQISYISFLFTCWNSFLKGTNTLSVETDNGKCQVKRD